MGKTCKSCNKQNHFAKMCRSNQVNEITVEISCTEKECNLNHSSDSCDEFEFMVVEAKLNNTPEKVIGKTISGVNDNNEITATKDVRKIDIRRDPKSHQIKALKALVRINRQIINVTIDTGRPVSFLNWTTAKQLLEGAPEIKFIPAEKLNLTTQFVDYNKQPIQIQGALCTSIRSAGWEVQDASLLVTERRARCILGLGLQGKLGIHTSQKSAPSKRSRFDVLLCEYPEGMKHQFYKKFPSLFDREKKPTRLDRNENGQNSCLSNCEQTTLSKLSHCEQSVDIRRNNCKNTEKHYQNRKSRMEEKLKKTVKKTERERNRDQMLEQVTETTYRRIQTVRKKTYHKLNGGKWTSSIREGKRDNQSQRQHIQNPKS